MPTEDPDARAEEGEAMEFEPEEEGVEDTDDGGAIVRVEDAGPSIEETKRFYRNLAEDLDSSTLTEIGTRLIDDTSRDIEERKPRDKLYEEGIKRTGLGNEAPGGANFNGASRTVHPMLAKACVDFGARAVKELLPSSDVVRTFIPGEINRPRLDKAKRKQRYMNWQFKRQMPEFRAELEQVLTQLPLSGSNYLYMVYDRDKGRPVPQFWPIDDVVIPFAATNFYNAERRTMLERITTFEFERRVANGQYLDVPSFASIDPEFSSSAEASHKIEGKQLDGTNEDGLREIRRIFCWLEIEDDEVISTEEKRKVSGKAGKFAYAPYSVEIETGTRRVLSIVRNWEKGDGRRQPMDWLIDFTFLYWRGAVGVGLTHLIGSLSGAATGAIRALLDSAHVNNLPTLLKLKGANFGGQNVELNACAVTEIEGGLGSTDPDIRKLVLAVPFNQPSPALYQLLGFLTEQGESVVRTTFDGLVESAQPNMPVGTMLSLVEQGMKVLGAIHLRLFDSMSRVLTVLDRINRMYLDDEELRDETGELLAYRKDFQGPLDIIPVADPETFSDAQRFAQIQMVAQRAITLPQLYDLRKVEELILERTKIPDAKDLLLPAPKPMQMNAVNENAAAAFGRPISAFPEQDHLSHIQAHCDFMESPFLGACLLIAPRALPTLLNHLAEHVVLWYVTHTVELASGAMGNDISLTMKHKDPETRAELDKTLAVASHRAVSDAKMAFAGIPAVIQRAQALLDQLAPQLGPMQDPKIAVAQIKSADDAKKRSQEAQQAEADRMAEDRRKVADLNAEREARAEKAQADARKSQNQAAQAMQRDQASLERTVVGNDSRERINEADNETALRIAAAEIASAERVEVNTGEGINPGS